MLPKTPSLTANPGNAVIASGTRVILTCTTFSVGTATYTFFKGTSELTRQTVSSVFNTVATTDSGAYTCVATINGRVSAASNKYLLDIQSEFQRKNTNVNNMGYVLLGG